MSEPVTLTLKIRKCEECPKHGVYGGQWFCDHQGLELKPGRIQDPETIPTWCPLRKASTMSEPKIGEVRHFSGCGSVVYLGGASSFVTGTEADCNRLSILLTEAEEMREVLRSVEWSATYEVDQGCPVCEAFHPGPHTPDCRLARLIGGTNAETV